MKTKTIFLFLFLLPFFVFGQIAFEKHYGTPSNFDGFNAAVPTADGNFLAAGTTATLGAGNFDIILHKFTADGGLIWQKTWDGGGHDQAKGLIAVSTGGFLLTGDTEVGGVRQYLLWRLDEEGNEMWKTTGGNEYPGGAKKTVELSSGEFVTTGWKVNDSNPDEPFYENVIYHFDAAGTLLSENKMPGIVPEYGFVATSDTAFLALANYSLFKISPQGEVLFEKNIVPPSGASLYMKCLKKLPDGQVWISGTTTETGNLFLASIDEEGEIMAYYAPISPDVPYSLPGTDLAQASPSKMWIHVKGYYYSSGTYAWAMLDFDDGEVQFSLTPEELGLGGKKLTGAFLSSPDGDLVLAGKAASNREGNNGFMASISKTGDLLWEKTVGTVAPGDWEAGQKVLQTDDGGFVLMATRNNAETGEDSWVIRTDASGNVLWASEIGGENDERPTDMALTADGSIVVVGRSGDFPFVFKLSSDGDLSWQKEFSIFINYLNPLTAYYGPEMVVDENEDIFLTIPSIPASFLHLSPAGDSIALHTFDFDPYYTSAIGITLSSDGKLLLCGSANDNFDSEPGFILKTEKNGDLLWDYFMYIDHFTAIHKAFEHPDGRIFAQVHSFGLPGINQDLMELNADHSSHEIIPIPEGEPYSRWLRLCGIGQGNALFFGYFYHAHPDLTGSTTSAAIVRLGETGEVTGENDFGRKERAKFNAGIATSDGGFAAIGTATFDKSQDVYFVKTLPDGTVDWQTALTPPFEINIGPNPVGDALHWSAGGLGPGSFSVRIFASDGAVLRSENHVNNAGNLNNPPMNVGTLPSGLYYFQIRQNGKAATVNWVKL